MMVNDGLDQLTEGPPTLPLAQVCLPYAQLAPVALTKVLQGLALLVQVTLQSFLRCDVAFMMIIMRSE